MILVPLQTGSVKSIVYSALEVLDSSLRPDSGST